VIFPSMPTLILWTPVSASSSCSHSTPAQASRRVCCYRTYRERALGFRSGAGAPRSVILAEWPRTEDSGAASSGSSSQLVHSASSSRHSMRPRSWRRCDVMPLARRSPCRHQKKVRAKRVNRWAAHHFRDLGHVRALHCVLQLQCELSQFEPLEGSSLELEVVGQHHENRHLGHWVAVRDSTPPDVGEGDHCWPTAEVASQSSELSQKNSNLVKLSKTHPAGSARTGRRGSH